MKGAVGTVAAACVVGAVGLVACTDAGPDTPVGQPTSSHPGPQSTGGSDEGQPDLTCRFDTFSSVQPEGDGDLPTGATKVQMCTYDIDRTAVTSGPRVAEDVDRIVELVNAADTSPKGFFDEGGDGQNCEAILRFQHALILEYPDGYQRVELNEGTGNCDQFLVEQTSRLGASEVLALVDELAD